MKNYALCCLCFLVSGLAAAKEAGNRPYVQSGCEGVFYARCLPRSDWGPEGTTEIYRVWEDHDELVDHYDWFTKWGVFLAWSSVAGKVAVLAIQESVRPPLLRREVELRFYLGGKLLKTWSPEDLRKLGGPPKFIASDGPIFPFRVMGAEQIPGTNEDVFLVDFSGKSYRFDVLTGDLSKGQAGSEGASNP